MGGWILLHRRFFDHPFWTEKREFSKAEAWIDLIEQARWKDEETSLMHNGQIVKWSRGQLVASVRFLRDRWKWRSNNKVSRFLDLLEKEDMIRYDKRTAIGRITICKYDTYQAVRDAERDTNGTQTGQAEDKTGKKGKEGKAGNGRFTPPSQEDVFLYMQDRGGSGAEAEKFYDFYQSKNWYVGKNKMKDWNAAVRNWMRNTKNNSQESPPPGFPRK